MPTHNSCAHLRTLTRAVDWLALASALACGGSDTTSPRSNPIPVLLSVSPTQLVSGVQGATVTLSGSGFVRSSRVRWNDSDRVTNFVSDTRLTVELLASDLASIATGTLVVVNPPPDGGTSAAIEMPIAYPTPLITSIAPASFVIGAPAVSVVVDGTGFVSQSIVHVDSTGLFVATLSSPSKLTFSLPYLFFNTAGTHKITIVNPAPGGGTSNAFDFSVSNPAPQIIATTPDTVITGAPLTLIIDGTGFVSTSAVQWNGSSRPTTFRSMTRITAAIPASDVAAASTATITVVNPAPGGGVSPAVSLRVHDPSPRITSVNPSTIVAGSANTTLSISGANFSTSSVVQWNGNARAATFISATALSLTLNTSDVSSPGTGRLVIVNPGSSGASNTMAVAIVAASPTLTVGGTIALKNTDIISDPTRGVIYASVPSSGGANANSVVKIDPLTASIVGSVVVGSEPGPMAISDDGTYLYVGLGGAPSVVRVHLPTFTKDIEFQLGNNAIRGPMYAEDLVVLPGLPRSVVVSRRNSCCSPRHEGVAIYDDGVARPRVTDLHTGSNRIVRGPSAARLYGYNNETTEFGFRSIRVNPDGLLEEIIATSLVSGLGVDIEFDGAYVYSTNGSVIDPVALKRIGSIPASGTVCPDAASARVHYLASGAIQTFHYASFNAIGSVAAPALNGLTRLARWGVDGLAAGGGDSIVILSGSLAGP